MLLPRRDPPPGATIEATFEDPAGGPPIVLSRPARGGGRIQFETPPVHGVKKGVPYRVTVVLRGADGTEILKIEKDYKSDVDQSVLPDRPLAIGPGYQTNIDKSTTPFPPAIFRHPPDSGKPNDDH